MLSLSLLDAVVHDNWKYVWLKFLSHHGYLHNLCASLQWEDDGVKKMLDPVPESPQSSLHLGVQNSKPWMKFPKKNPFYGPFIAFLFFCSCSRRSLFMLQTELWVLTSWLLLPSTTSPSVASSTFNPATKATQPPKQPFLWRQQILCPVFSRVHCNNFGVLPAAPVSAAQVPLGSPDHVRDPITRRHGVTGDCTNLSPL